MTTCTLTSLSRVHSYVAQVRSYVHPVSCRVAIRTAAVAHAYVVLTTFPSLRCAVVRCADHVSVFALCCALFCSQVLQVYDFQDTDKWANMAVLAAMVVIYRGIAAWIMSR
jgi:hypothetical protein